MCVRQREIELDTEIDKPVSRLGSNSRDEDI